MNPIALMQIVIDCVLFFGMSDDDTLDPDSAVRQLEIVASRLQDLPEVERKAFLAYVQSVADEEQALGGDANRIDFLQNLGEYLGLRDG